MRKSVVKAPTRNKMEPNRATPAERAQWNPQ